MFLSIWLKLNKNSLIDKQWLSIVLCMQTFQQILKLATNIPFQANCGNSYAFFVFISKETIVLRLRFLGYHVIDQLLGMAIIWRSKNFLHERIST